MGWGQDKVKAVVGRGAALNLGQFLSTPSRDKGVNLSEMRV